MRQTQKEVTKNKILSAAKMLLQTQGYHITTIRQIASKSGIATGTVFSHFENKEVLFYHAFYEELEQIRKEAVANAASENTLHAQIETIFFHLFDSFAQEPLLYSHFLEHALLVKGEWGKRFEEQAHTLGLAIGAFYTQAQMKNEISMQAHVPTAVIAVFSFYYFLLLGSIKKRFADIQQIRSQFSMLLTQHLNGLKENSI